MSLGERHDMARVVLHRSYGKLILRYDDGFEDTIYDKERIRWLLNGADSLVSFLFLMKT